MMSPDENSQWFLIVVQITKIFNTNYKASHNLLPNCLSYTTLHTHFLLVPNTYNTFSHRRAFTHAAPTAKKAFSSSSLFS